MCNKCIQYSSTAVKMFCQGMKALHSPHTGIVDWGYVTHIYAENFKRRGGTVKLGFEVTRFEETRETPDFPVTVIGSNSVSNSLLSTIII